MKKPLAIIIILMLIAVFSASTFAQAADDIPNLVCPKFVVTASTLEAKEGDLVTFTASLTGGNVDVSKLDYSWNMSPRGRIASGGSPNVQVLDTSRVKSGSVTVTVTVNFQMCPKVASETVLIRRGPTYAKVDDFWLWFQRHGDDYRDNKKNAYDALLEELSQRLRTVDERLIIKLEHKWRTPGKVGLIVGFRDKPADEKVIEDFLRSAPDLPGFELLSAKEICELAF